MNFNKKLLCKVLGIVSLINLLMTLPTIGYAHYVGQHKEMFYLLISGTISLSLVIIFLGLVPKFEGHIRTKEGYLSMLLAMVLVILEGTIPYLSYKGATIIDALFESTAGLTTTTASVLSESTMSTTLLLWKALQHWVGGLGILILIIAIIPMLGIGEQQLATAENQELNTNKIAPRSKNIIMYIGIVYILITLLGIGYFYYHDLKIFDSIVLSMCCTSTANVFLHAGGISHYGNNYINIGVMIFTMLGGMSFVLYIHLIRKHFKEVIRNVEVKVFFMIIALSTITIWAILFSSNTYNSWQESLENGLFQSISFATTSGFAIDNYMVWPSSCLFILFILCLIGGCSASTTGSMRVIRLIISVKIVNRGIFKRLHPRGVKAIKVGGSTISAPMVSSVVTFNIVFLLSIICSTIIISLAILDMETTLSATIGLITNSGISFGNIGMKGDYGMFSQGFRLFLSLLMLVGRLGVLNLIIFLIPSFWNPHKKVM